MYEKDGHGLVAAISDLAKKMNWDTAKTACNELVLNGYSDWYLPSKEELNALSDNLKFLFERRHLELTYGSQSMQMYYGHWGTNAESGRNAWRLNNLKRKDKVVTYDKRYKLYVRPVRAF